MAGGRELVLGGEGEEWSGHGIRQGAAHARALPGRVRDIHRARQRQRPTLQTRLPRPCSLAPPPRPPLSSFTQQYPTLPLPSLPRPLQPIMFQLADKPGDPDPMDWAPPSSSTNNTSSTPSAEAAAASSAAPAAPGTAAAASAPSAAGAAVAAGGAGGPPRAVCFLDPASGQARLECLWGLPGPWDALHAAATLYAGQGTAVRRYGGTRQPAPPPCVRSAGLQHRLRLLV